MPFPNTGAAANAGINANLGNLVGGQANLKAQYGGGTGAANTSGSVGALPITLTVVIALYLFWAIVVRHERLDAQLRPASVAINLYNIFVVGFTALLFLLLGKVATVKLTALKVPGAAFVAQLFQAA